MADTLFWHVVAVLALILLAGIAVMLVLSLRNRQLHLPETKLEPSPKSTADGHATLTAFNAVSARDDEYIGLQRPDHDLLEGEDMNDYPPQARKFGEEILKLGVPVHDVHESGVDQLLLRWSEKMTAWYTSAGNAQLELAAYYERRFAYYDNQSLLGSAVDTIVGVLGADPLVKVRELRDAGKQFDLEYAQLTEEIEKLLSLRTVYLEELNRLRDLYAKRWEWQILPVQDAEVSEAE